MDSQLDVWSNPQLQNILSLIRNFILSLAGILVPYIPNISIVSPLFIATFIVWMVPILLVRKSNGLVLSGIVATILAYLTVGHL